MTDTPKKTFADFGITFAKLVEAIIAAYGARRSNEMAAIIAAQKEHHTFSRPYEHNAALRHVAVYGGPADAVSVLRSAAIVLDQHGFYCQEPKPVAEVTQATEVEEPSLRR